MDIGETKRIIEVEPVVEPVPVAMPEAEPVTGPVPARLPEPALPAR